MTLTRAATLPTLLIALVLLAVSPAAATDEESSPEETATTVAEDAPPDPNAPPVSVPDETPEAEDLPWTAKYMAPGMAVLAVVIFIVVVVYYFTRIRGRYEVVG